MPRRKKEDIENVQSQSETPEAPTEAEEEAQEEVTYNPADLLDDLQALCQHPRFRRYRLSIKATHYRAILYEATPSNILASFLYPQDGKMGQVFIRDRLARSAITIAGGETLQDFYEKYGPGRVARLATGVPEDEDSAPAEETGGTTGLSGGPREDSQEGTPSP